MTPSHLADHPEGCVRLALFINYCQGIFLSADVVGLAVFLKTIIAVIVAGLNISHIYGSATELIYA